MAVFVTLMVITVAWVLAAHLGRKNNQAPFAAAFATFAALIAYLATGSWSVVSGVFVVMFAGVFLAERRGL